MGRLGVPHYLKKISLTDLASNMESWLKLTYRVEEHPVVIVSEVAEIVGEAAEIVASADFEVFTDVVINGRQRTEIGGIGIRNPHEAALYQGIPFANDVEVSANNSKMRC